MRAKTLRFGATAVVAVASWLACSLAAHAGDNSWTNSANGYWEVGGNWSAGAPSINFGWHYITNANTKTVSAYSPLPASTLTISNLTISAPVGDTNTLYIYNLSEGPLTFSNSLTLLSGGALRVGNAATVRVESVSGGNFTVDGNALITGGQLTATNGSTHVGSAGVGEMTVSNGLALLGGTIVGHFPGSHGSLTVVGGTNQVLRELAVGNAAESTGSVLVTGGQFIATNSYTYMGALGVGQMTVSNGLALLQDAYIGRYFTSHGNLTVAGGTNQVLGFLHVGEGQDSTGSVLVTGGQLIATNSWTYVGESGVGRMTVSNGVALLRSVSIGNSAGSHGSLTIAGGTNQVLGDLLVAGWPNSMGSVLVSGGQLIVSNGWTDVGSSGIGEMTVSNGLALLQDAYIGRYAGSLGSLRVAGGTNQVLGLLEVGVSANSTGSVLVGGGQLIVTNNSTYVGHDGVGRMTVSNGLAQLQHTYVGYGDGSQGSLTVAGGTNQVLGSLQVGQSAGSTGSVLVTGGQLIATNDWTYVGNNGIGQMVVSNGLAMLGDTFVGYYGGSLGSLTVAGGTNQVLGVLFVAGAL
ncbi:MAG: hypothetical protein FJ388_12835, partial [Verrucomicrobia bacterium]|nr:hypothetical protein [Verrucomicrobiota bacterium]